MQAWSLLAIFLSTITGLVLEPLPVGAWAFLGLTTAVATKTLTFQAAFGAFTNDVIWLIVISFFFAKGFVKTGLGDRVANFFVTVLGKSTLGLSYGLVLSETLIAPAMPSTTARAGGVFLPIILSLAKQAGSLPGATARRVGAFLIQAQLQCAAHSSALFLTAAAQNLLALKLASEVTGTAISNPWVTWAVAAVLPAVVALAVTPYAVYKLLPPEVTSTPDAPAAAKARLTAMGPPSRDERIMVATMGLAVFLWVAGDAVGVSSVLAAMIALCVLLLGGVLQWADCLGEKSAWDTLTWFAVLVGMSGQLNNLGLVSYVSNAIGSALSAMNLTWPAVCVLMNAAYFGMHYIFASQTAHVGALLSACLAVMLAAGVPPVLGTLTLAYTTNLFGAITHYSSGQAAVYYGAGYTDLPTTFRMVRITLCSLGLTLSSFPSTDRANVIYTCAGRYLCVPESGHLGSRGRHMVEGDWSVLMQCHHRVRGSTTLSVPVMRPRRLVTLPSLHQQPWPLPRSQPSAPAPPPSNAESAPCSPPTSSAACFARRRHRPRAGLQ